jgi:hypothetical protein
MDVFNINKVKFSEDTDFTESKFFYLIYLQLISFNTNRVGLDFTYPVGFQVTETENTECYVNFRFTAVTRSCKRSNKALSIS